MTYTSLVLVGIGIFIVTTFLVWKMVNGYYKKVYSEKERETWGSKTYYWHFIIMVSGALSTLIIFILKWENILKF